MLFYHNQLLGLIIEYNLVAMIVAVLWLLCIALIGVFLAALLAWLAARVRRLTAALPLAAIALACAMAVTTFVKLAAPVAHGTRKDII